MLRVFNSDDIELLFDEEGRVTEDAADSVELILYPGDATVQLFLLPGTYTFDLTAHDDLEATESPIAFGETTVVVESNETVQIPMVSLLGSAELLAPEVVQANEVFDVFLEVHPPERDDLMNAEFDYEVSYDVSETGVVLGSSNLGLRVAAGCQGIDIGASVSSLAAIGPEQAQAEAQVAIQEDCVSITADLVPPYVAIDAPEDGASIEGSILVQGIANDMQSGIDRVEVYDGPILLGEATLAGETSPVEWSFELTPAENRVYDLIALAVDNETNTGRDQVSVSVTGSPIQALRTAVSTVMPDLEEFAVVSFDDSAAIESLQDLAFAGGTEPMYLELPVLTTEGQLSSHLWTVYPHNVRSSFEATPVLLTDSENEEGSSLQVLEGPSMTFQGVPNLDDGQLVELISQAEDEQLERDETVHQPSVVNLINGQIEGAYYGQATEFPYVIQGLQSVLEPHYGAEQASSLIADAGRNYLVYNHAGYQPRLEHIDQFVETTSAESVFETQNHFFEDGLKTLHLVPVADDTIYDPDTGNWAITDWFDRMEAAANRMTLFWIFAQLGPDIPSSESTLSSDNNRFAIRTRIPEYRVLTQFGKTELNDHSTVGCGGDGSYRGEIREISNSTLSYDNEYWLWSTQEDFSGGGCSYTETLGLSPRGGGGTTCDYITNRDYDACGSVGYIELRSSHTQDWSSLVVMHETGHALNGRHDTDAYGNSGESSNSHQCKFFGVWEFGPTGPSIMSYASGSQTYCFALTPSDGTPKKNTTGIAEHLHDVLD